MSARDSWMRRGALLLLIGLAGPAAAATTQLKCTMLTTFHKMWIGDTQWSHVELTKFEPHGVTKYFLIDDAAKSVAVYNSRANSYVPICSPANKACVVQWSTAMISVDATHAPDNPVPPHLDFRRAFLLTDHASKARLIIADFGDSSSGKENMDWTYEGNCEPSAGKPPSLVGGPGAPAATFVDELALPISDAERDRVWEPRRGNTMTGLSAGGHSWFHFWFFDHGIGYTGDAGDFTNEGTTRQWYIGKTPSGEYRLCEQPVPKEGEKGCYPFADVKVGDSWTEQDVYGPASFTLLPGRQ